MAKALDFGLHLLNTLEIPGSTPGVVVKWSSDPLFLQILHSEWAYLSGRGWIQPD
jgi:hypothetical protein